MKFKLIFSAFLTLLLCSCMPQLTSAQTTGSGIVVSPSSGEVSLMPGGATTLSFTIKNISSSSVTLKTLFNNFSPGIEGNPTIQTGSEVNDYGLKTWLKPIADFSVKAGETRPVSINITAPVNSKNQTYYGVVRFVPLDSSGKTSVLASVGSLIFVNIGQYTYTGEISDLKVPASEMSQLGDTTATIKLSIKNTGKYKFTPTLVVNIVDENGKMVKMLLPENPGSVLPESTREYTYKYIGSLDIAKSYFVQPNVSLPDGTVLTGSGKVPLLNSAAQSTQTKKVTTPVKAKKTSIPILTYGIAVGVLVLMASAFVVLRIKKHGGLPSTNSIPMAPVQPVSPVVAQAPNLPIQPASVVPIQQNQPMPPVVPTQPPINPDMSSTPVVNQQPIPPQPTAPIPPAQPSVPPPPESTPPQIS